MKNVLIFFSTWMMVLIGTVLFFLWYDFNTKQVIVAVLDTGVNPNHELLKGNVLKGYDFVNRDNDPIDENGHGTHVAGIIAQNASKTKILPVRTIGEEGKVGINSTLPIMYSIIKGADIINMSYSEESSLSVKFMVWLGEKKGILFVAATGNDGKKKISYPAAYKGVYAIAASDEETNAIYENSNIDKKVQFITPGVNIKSAGIHEHQYTEKTGTSMASAYMSGALAYFKEKHPSFTNKQLLQQIKNTSNKWGSYEIVDLKKEKALHDKKAYIWIQKPDMFETEKEVNFTVHTDGVDETKVFQETHLLTEKKGNLHKMFRVELQQGENEFKVTAKKGDSFTDHYFTVVLDELQPKINTHFFRENGYYFLKIEIDEPYLKEIKIEGNAKETVLNSFSVPSNEEMVLKINSYDFPMKIQVTDYSGNQTEKEFSKDILR